MNTGRSLEFRLLGRFAVLRDGAEIPAAAFGGRKVRTLLRVLASRRGDLVSNDALTEMLWPDRAPADPAANLQVLVNRARKALGDPDAIRTGTGGYALDERCAVDSDAFLTAVAAADTQRPEDAFATLRAALPGWGEPLPEDAFAEWATQYRDRLTAARQRALEQSARIALARDELRIAVEDASIAADAEPTREAAVLTLVRALAASGDPAGALRRYETFRRTLAGELGVDPSAEAQAVHADLLRPGPDTPRPDKRRPDQPRPDEPGPAPSAHPAPEWTELPFVGRTEQADAIVTCLAAPSRGVTVVVSGDSGAGKSRLLSAVGERVPILVARSYLPERERAWSLVRTLVREIIDRDVAYVDALPAALAAAARSLVPELGAADGDDSAGSETLRALRQEAVIRMLGLLDHAVVLDDLQWADPTSLSVLELARDRTPGLRLLLSYRTGALPDAAAGWCARLDPELDVQLGELSDDALGELVADTPLRDALLTHTDRSPLAIREVLRALAAAGRISRGPGRSWSSVDATTAGLAAEIGARGQRRGIVARAGVLSPGDRELLEAICLLAREAQPATLGATAGITEQEVADRLTRLYRAGLVRLGELGWTTTHDMVNDAVIGELDAATLARRHAQVAAATERDGPDPAEAARHWLAAGDRTHAARAFAAAAHRALDAFADAEAAAAADAGLEVQPDAPDLLEVRAQARARRGDIAGARADLRAALRHHDIGPARARLLGRLAMLASGSDDMVRAAGLAESALVAAGSDRPARATALEIAAIIDMNLGRTERADERSATALDLYRELADARGTARVIDARAMATFLGGDVAEGRRALARAADLFEDSGDLVHVVTPRSTSGHAAVFAGDAEDGRRLSTAALELARTLGHPEGQAYALWHRAEALAALHRPDEAMGDAREALSIATEVGHRGWTATSWRAIGIAAQEAGDLDTALAAFERSLRASDHLDLFAGWAAARAAMVLVHLGELTRAAAMVARAEAVGPPLARYEIALTRVLLARALGEHDAGALTSRTAALFERGGVRQGLDLLDAATR